MHVYVLERLYSVEDPFALRSCNSVHDDKKKFTCIAFKYHHAPIRHHINPSRHSTSPPLKKRHGQPPSNPNLCRFSMSFQVLAFYVWLYHAAAVSTMVSPRVSIDRTGNFDAGETGLGDAYEESSPMRLAIHRLLFSTWILVGVVGHF
jgi:hypothetical protein